MALAIDLNRSVCRPPIALNAADQYALYFGDTKASSDIVGDVVKTHGGVATVFMKSGDQLVRVATTVMKEDGTSAEGTALAHQLH